MDQEVKCSICGNESFTTFNGRELARCSQCNSLERTRALYDYLSKEVIPRFKGKDIKILECAGHLGMKKALIAQFPNIKDYRCFDIGPRDSNDFISDLLELDEISDHSIDLFIACHVIEHVTDYKRALRTMTFKIHLGGTIILMVPFEGTSQTEVEKYPEVNHNGHIWRFTAGSFKEICDTNLGNTAVVNPNEIFHKQYGTIRSELNTIFDFGSYKSNVR